MGLDMELAIIKKATGSTHLPCGMMIQSCGFFSLSDFPNKLFILRLFRCFGNSSSGRTWATRLSSQSHCALQGYITYFASNSAVSVRFVS